MSYCNYLSQSRQIILFIYTIFCQNNTPQSTITPCIHFMETTMTNPPLFHLAIPVTNLSTAHHFYVDVLGCSVGRTAERWIDISFWGHQVSLHLIDDSSTPEHNVVDGDNVPTRHFGAILEWNTWHKFAEDLSTGQYKDEIQWIIKPKIRFAGEVGEQATMFFADGCGNYLEFKLFMDMNSVFAH